MNILIAVHHFPPAFGGGSENRALRTARALIARGHRVRVVCVENIRAESHSGLTHVDDVFDGIPVRRLSFNAAASPDPARFEYDNPWIGAAIAQMLREERPDVFHLFSGYLITGRALLEAAAAQVPSVLSLTDFWFLCRRVQMVRSDGTLSRLPIDPRACARCVAEESRRYRLPARVAPALADWFWRRETPLSRRLAARADFLRKALNTVGRIVSPSEFVHGVFIQAGVEPARLVYCRQGRDFPDHAGTIRERGPLLRLGVLGQIIPMKGVHVAVEAMRLIGDPRVRLSIYGSTQADPRYAAAIAAACAKDARIALCKPFQADDISLIYGDLDAAIVPSIWYENSPNVILEAFAHRAPVIASNLGGMSELVRHGMNGLTFSPGDGADLARQIRRLLDEPRLLSSLSAGIEPIKTLDEEMDELESVYRGVARPL